MKMPEARNWVDLETTYQSLHQIDLYIYADIRGCMTATHYVAVMLCGMCGAARQDLTRVEQPEIT